MHISEVGLKSGLSVDTIRYYEKLGLLPRVARDRAGRRQFTIENVDWLVLLSSLRETGMSLGKMRRFAELYELQDDTLSERKAFLLDHAAHLHKQKARISRCADLLSHKIERYDEMIAGRQ